MIGVEQWAEIRRMHFVEGLSMREIHRRTGLHRKTDPRRAGADDAAGLSPRRRRRRSSIRSRAGSSELLRADPRDPVAAAARAGRRSWAMRAARRSSTTTCARCGRAFCVAADLSAHASIGPGSCASSICGSRARRSRSATARRRRGWVVTAELGWSRAIAGALVFSKEAPDIALGHGPLPARGSARCRRSWSGTARARSTPAAAARPTRSPPSAARSASAG